MLTISDTRKNHHCQGSSRRDFLRIGSLGMLGGLGLPELLAARARAAAGSDSSSKKDKAVVLLFLSGGPSHIEFFDPKMSAPEDIRSMTGEVQTKLPGITFGGTFKKLANMTDKLAIVRSYASMNAGHTYDSVTTGGNSLKASMGAMYARVVGNSNAATGFPTNTLVLPEAVEAGLKLGGNFETGALPTLTTPGELGPGYAAFDPSGGDQLKKNLQMKIPQERFSDRRQLLAGLDSVRREMDASGAMEGLDRFQQQAFDVIVRGVGDAFDLSKEDPKTVAKYDTSGLFKREDITKWYDMKRASNLLGKQLLMARRLCEAGCGFVTVSDCGWDMHANENSPKNMAGLPPMSSQVDHAVAAFIEDLHERGLSDKILLVVTGEMGRTPRRNKNGGRDHYPNLTTLLLAGGGLKMGQVIGQSDRTASQPATERYTPKNLMATIMGTILDLGEVRVRPGLGRVANVLTESDPIPGLL
ncbi:MAG: DUF1501 domain-containing protein [Planctomycetaceae bacterium]|nr:DUF1501 domain-containing protein [Planctomycetaceae bacterium]